MNTDQVEAHLRSHLASLAGLPSAVGRRNNAAFLRVESLGGPQRWAVVASPGRGWFAVELPGGFSLNHYDEDLENHEVRAILDDYVAVAVAFVRSGATHKSVGRLRSPVLVVSMPQGDRVFRRSVVADVRQRVGFRRPGRRRGST